MSFFKDNQGSSGWGGFLKQAINNMESQLDKVLDFPDEETNKLKPQIQQKSHKPKPIKKIHSNGVSGSDPLGANIQEIEKETKLNPNPNPLTSPNSLKEEILLKEEPLLKEELKVMKNKEEKVIEKQTNGQDNKKLNKKEHKKRVDDKKMDEKKEEIGFDKIQDEDNIDYKKIAEQREIQLMNAINNTSALNETISNLEFNLSKLQKEKEDSEKRWLARVNGLENKLLNKTEEIDTNLPDDLDKLKSMITGLKTQLEGKDEQISGLMQEGEALTKKELKMSTILQKVRNKENENERVLVECQKKLGQVVKENSDLKSRVSGLITSEKKANDIIRALKQNNDQIRKEKEESDNKCKRLTDNEVNLKISLEKSQLEVRNLQKEIQKSINQNLKIQKEKETKDKGILADEAIALKLQMEEIEKESQTIVQNLRQELIKTQDKLSAKEEEFQNELMILKSTNKIINNNNNNDNEDVDNINKVDDDDVNTVIELATQPLLNQIQTLKLEIYNLTSKVKEYEKNLKISKENNLELTIKLETTEKTLKDNLEINDKSIETLELSYKTMVEELQIIKQNNQILLSDKETLEFKVNELQETINSLKQSHLLEMEQLRKLYEFKEPSIISPRSSSVSPSPPASSYHEEQNSRPINNPHEFNDSIINTYPYTNRTRNSSLLPEHTTIGPMIQPNRTRSSRSSIDFRVENRNISPTSGLTGMNNLSNDNKIRTLQIQLKAALESKDQLSNELVQLSCKFKEYEATINKINNMELEHQELVKKHEIVLELLGEKSEQLEDVKADLQEAKLQYKKQLTELISKIPTS
ncbi:hypothetical protein K502DRAFT_323450 [Neoconidiobolus thromboides FSU 785]|nr:hypothetical protein K502DRAFT_323450 [Neoconidiobolus thromboides FSU 785]